MGYFQEFTFVGGINCVEYLTCLRSAIMTYFSTSLSSLSWVRFIVGLLSWPTSILASTMSPHFLWTCEVNTFSIFEMCILSASNVELHVSCPYSKVSSLPWNGTYSKTFFCKIIFLIDTRIEFHITDYQWLCSSMWMYWIRRVKWCIFS